MKPLPLLAVLIVTTACSQQVYSPPAQTFAVNPITALPQGRRSVGIDVSSHAGLFDPSIDAGAGRLRVGIGDDAEVSLEGTVHQVQDSGPSRANRMLYSGRVGVHSNAGRTPFAVFAGAGGGYAPAGGSFAAVDAGIAVGTRSCVLAPVMQVSGFLSQPLAPRPVDVSVDADRPPVYDTPRRTYGGVLRGGVRLSLTPSACRRGEPGAWLTGGFGATKVMDAETADGLLGFGFGLEIPLE